MNLCFSSADRRGLLLILLILMIVILTTLIILLILTHIVNTNDANHTTTTTTTITTTTTTTTTTTGEVWGGVSIASVLMVAIYALGGPPQLRQEIKGLFEKGFLLDSRALLNNTLALFSLGHNLNNNCQTLSMVAIYALGGPSRGPPNWLLKHILHSKVWNSHVHRGFLGKFESTNLSREILSRETGRTGAPDEASLAATSTRRCPSASP